MDTSNHFPAVPDEQDIESDSHIQSSNLNIIDENDGSGNSRNSDSTGLENDSDGHHEGGIQHENDIINDNDVGTAASSNLDRTTALNEESDLSLNYNTDDQVTENSISNTNNQNCYNNSLNNNCNNINNSLSCSNYNNYNSGLSSRLSSKLSTIPDADLTVQAATEYLKTLQQNQSQHGNSNQPQNHNAATVNQGTKSQSSESNTNVTATGANTNNTTVNQIITSSDDIGQKIQKQAKQAITSLNKPLTLVTDVLNKTQITQSDVNDYKPIETKMSTAALIAQANAMINDAETSSENGNDANGNGPMNSVNDIYNFENYVSDQDVNDELGSTTVPGPVTVATSDKLDNTDSAEHDDATSEKSIPPELPKREIPKYTNLDDLLPYKGPSSSTSSTSESESQSQSNSNKGKDRDQTMTGLFESYRGDKVNKSQNRSMGITSLNDYRQNYNINNQNIKSQSSRSTPRNQIPRSSRPGPNRTTGRNAASIPQRGTKINTNTSSSFHSNGSGGAGNTNSNTGPTNVNGSINQAYIFNTMNDRNANNMVNSNTPQNSHSVGPRGKFLRSPATGATAASGATGNGNTGPSTSESNQTNNLTTVTDNSDSLLDRIMKDLKENENLKAITQGHNLNSVGPNGIAGPNANGGFPELIDVSSYYKSIVAQNRAGSLGVIEGSQSSDLQNNYPGLFPPVNNQNPNSTNNNMTATSAPNSNLTTPRSSVASNSQNFSSTTFGSCNNGMPSGPGPNVLNATKRASAGRNGHGKNSNNMVKGPGGHGGSVTNNNSQDHSNHKFNNNAHGPGGPSTSSSSSSSSSSSQPTKSSSSRPPRGPSGNTNGPNTTNINNLPTRESEILGQLDRANARRPDLRSFGLERYIQENHNSGSAATTVGAGGAGILSAGPSGFGAGGPNFPSTNVATNLLTPSATTNLNPKFFSILTAAASIQNSGSVSGTVGSGQTTSGTNGANAMINVGGISISQNMMNNLNSVGMNDNYNSSQSSSGSGNNTKSNYSSDYHSEIQANNAIFATTDKLIAAADEITGTYMGHNTHAPNNGNSTVTGSGGPGQGPSNPNSTHHSHFSVNSTNSNNTSSNHSHGSGQVTSDRTNNFHSGSGNSRSTRHSQNNITGPPVIATRPQGNRQMNGTPPVIATRPQGNSSNSGVGQRGTSGPNGGSGSGPHVGPPNNSRKLVKQHFPSNTNGANGVNGSGNTNNSNRSKSTTVTKPSHTNSRSPAPQYVQVKGTGSGSEVI